MNPVGRQTCKLVWHFHQPNSKAVYPPASNSSDVIISWIECGTHTHTHTPGPLYIHETHDLWSLVSHQRLQKQLLHLQPGNLIWIDTDTKSSHVFNTKLLRCVPFIEVKVGSRHTLIACLILSDPTRTFSRNVVTKGSNFFQVACQMSMQSDWQVKLYVYVYITLQAVKDRKFEHWFNHVYFMCAYAMVYVVSLYSS